MTQWGEHTIKKGENVPPPPHTHGTKVHARAHDTNRLTHGIEHRMFGGLLMPDLNGWERGMRTLTRGG